MHQNLWTFLEQSLQHHKSNTAWIIRNKSGNSTVSYEQLYQAALTTTDRLRNAGVGAGDTVGITAPNGPEWCVAALACWKLGAIIAPVHIGNSKFDIQNQINAVNPAAMLIHDTDDIDTECMEISLVPDDDAVTREAAIETPKNGQDTAVRLYTSGSTGSPKVVRLSHSNHTSNVLAACNLVPFNQKDRFISLLPLSHAMGLTANLLLPLYCGGTIVVPRVIAAAEILETMENEKISVLIAVPRLYRNIMNGLEKKFAGASPLLRGYIWLIRKSPLFLKRCLNAPVRRKLGDRISVWVSGGSRLDGNICSYFHSLGLPLRQGYGLTETSPLACVQDDFDPAVLSVGRPINDVEIRISNPDPDGQGEVWIKGPNVMLGYENEEQNSDAFEDGWFKTGDIGNLDQAGKLYLTGRSKRLIVTEAGKNVYPEDLETLLERDPRVTEAGVFELDMKPACVLAIASGDLRDTAREVIRNFNALVSPHNQITRFAAVQELPRTPLGKLALQQLPVIFSEHEID